MSGAGRYRDSCQNNMPDACEGEMGRRKVERVLNCSVVLRKFWQSQEGRVGEPKTKQSCVSPCIPAMVSHWLGTAMGGKALG